ncbi:hypothetical protein A6R68_13799, partial [Neotoma lepida]
RLLNQYPSVVSVLVQKNKTGKRSLRNSSPAQTVAIVDNMLFCDSCDRGFHMECCDPPLTRMP